MIRTILLGKNGISASRIFYSVVGMVMVIMLPVVIAFRLVSEQAIDILLKPPHVLGFTLSGLMMGIVFSIFTAVMALLIFDQVLTEKRMEDE